MPIGYRQSGARNQMFLGLIQNNLIIIAWFTQIMVLFFFLWEAFICRPNTSCLMKKLHAMCFNFNRERMEVNDTLKAVCAIQQGDDILEC